MNKKAVLTVVSLIVAANIFSQTMNVTAGSVSYAFNAEETGTMTFSESGKRLTIQEKTFAVSDIDGITFSSDAVSDNSVSVTYSGTSADVVVAGNIARYLTVSVSDAYVSVIADGNLTEEVTYTLSGKATDGSFRMDGEYMATIVLNGVNITSGDSCAVNIENGKKITVNIADGTVNTLVDASSARERGACFNIQGHAQFTGSGSLTVTGKYKHAYRSHEYTRMTSDFCGTFTVADAKGDGMHIEQYFELDGGTVTINDSSDGGDGLDVGITDDASDKNNGQIIITGGTLTVTTTGDTCKAIKSDSAMTVSGGTVTASTSGDAYTVYEEDAYDASSCSTLKPGTDYIQTGGTVTAWASGIGGRSFNGGGTVNISGGTLTVYTTGTRYVDSEHKDSQDEEIDVKCNSLKTDSTINMKGGNIYSFASGKGRSFKTDDTSVGVNFAGATVFGAGEKEINSMLTGSYAEEKEISLEGGATVTYGTAENVAIPSAYSNSTAYIIYSK